MTVVPIIERGKKYTLAQHWRDTRRHMDKLRMENSYYYSSDADRQIEFFVAYERWLNDRELLSIEDSPPI